MNGVQRKCSETPASRIDQTDADTGGKATPTRTVCPATHLVRNTPNTSRLFLMAGV